MSLIDMSRVLDNPVFLDTFTVLRRVQTVGSNGRASVSTTTLPNIGGVVYPADKNDLDRFPDFQVTGKTLAVITRFALRSEAEASGTEYSPDVIQWKGDNFLVKKIEDWSNFGPGFIFALCSSIDLVDQPPVTE